MKAWILRKSAPIEEGMIRVRRGEIQESNAAVRILEEGDG